MASGFFLGGISQGYESSEKRRIEEQRQQAADELANRRQSFLEQSTVTGQARTDIANTMTAIGDTIAKLKESGVEDSEKIRKQIDPLLQSAQRLAANPNVGIDPNSLSAKVGALLATPKAPVEGKWKSQVVEENPTTGTKKYALVNEATGEIRPGNAPATPSTPRVVGTEEGVARGLYEPPPGSPAETVAMRFAPSLAQANPPSTMPAPAETPKSAPATPPTSEVSPQTQALKQRIDFAAEQYLQGNQDVLKGFGGSRTGAGMRRAIMDRAAEMAAERGLKPEDVNANISQYKGQLRGAQALGQRMANISASLNMATATLPRALEASNNVDRTEFPDINKIILAAKERTGDPKVVKMGIALNTFILAYARAQGGGNSLLTDSARNEAQSLLQRAWSKGQISSALDQMLIELRAEEQGARDAITNFPKKYRGDEGGKSAPAAAPSGGVTDWRDYFGKK